MTDKTKKTIKTSAKDDTYNQKSEKKLIKEIDNIFCDKCGNILDISRTIFKKNNEIDSDTPREISSSSDGHDIPEVQDVSKILDDDDRERYEEFLKRVENGDKLTTIELKTIDIKEMVKSDYYKKMIRKGDTKKLILDMIEDMGNSDENIQAYLFCKNCLFTKPIKTQLRILTKNPEGMTTNRDYVSEANYRNRTHMGTMSCTRNFHCSNKKCKVYTKQTPQEAIFFRKNADSYETIYVCKICKTVKIN